jgi:hypothetical protein
MSEVGAKSRQLDWPVVGRGVEGAIPDKPVRVVGTGTMASVRELDGNRRRGPLSQRLMNSSQDSDKLERLSQGGSGHAGALIQPSRIALGISVPPATAPTCESVSSSEQLVNPPY